MNETVFWLSLFFTLPAFIVLAAIPTLWIWNRLGDGLMSGIIAVYSALLIYASSISCALFLSALISFLVTK